MKFDFCNGERVDNMSNNYDEWQKLCEEYEAAREAHFKAYNVVKGKFVEIANGSSLNNPTKDEFDKLETTWSTWEKIKQRMSDFGKTNS